MMDSRSEEQVDVEMDSNDGHEASFSVDHGDTGYPEAELNKVNFVERLSSNGESIGELGKVSEVITRLELDLARSSEKLVNLSVLMMHVATREGDFEALASDKGHTSVESEEKALEFDLLSGILDSEVGELNKFLAVLQMEFSDACELLSSCTRLEENFIEIEKRLHDSEQSLKQSQDQLSEIRMQSTKLQRTLLCFNREENWIGDKGVGFVEAEQFLDVNAKINMQTAEQQRHILRMLEKSLEKEMDLEKKLTESRQIEEELKLRLHSSEEEVYCMEDETANVWERWLEADNASAVLMGLSKELLGRLQILQLNLNGLAKKEAELRSKLEVSMQELEAKETTSNKFESSSAELNDFFLAQTDNLKSSLREAEDKLILANSEAFTLREKLSSLEKQLKESEFQLLNAKVSVDGSHEQHNALLSKVSGVENVIADLKEEISKAECRAQSSEAKCKLLAETNLELIQELDLLKSSGDASAKVDSLERQLRESDIKLQHAIASAEAGQEKQKLLCSTIGDMENVIEKLKHKASKAESLADSTEDKCIILSESNAELTEELNFLRGKVECLEGSLQQAAETKRATAKDIGIQTEAITNLVMQLALERERLHKQISTLAMENKILILKVQHTNSHPSVVVGHSNIRNDNELVFSKHDLACTNKEEVTELSSAGSKMDKSQKNVPFGETETGPVDSSSELETVRRIDAGLLNFKHLFLAFLIVIISAAAYVLQQQNSSF
ncbi:WPP domain-interacting tail-anchored protein 1 [Ziziphus jujuba]|uniref:WPP domain-interacting tail-anchored protein 1 n=1 Tax=Ziziphus jujuba TaxID=326968 RepID=A0A6P3ZXU3_ZIZJJ|nr:WPP domain-interacting tail-anchored protein 1 [Ziziphus jujuba]XP_024928453.2 WPP domain-interacting tail-anchored protein 1 [Ziziphus jujuba]